jgi:competence ComEA-like helix-hairpin-helix protein
MKRFFEFSKSQIKTLTLLGIVVLGAGSYTIIRDYVLQPEDFPHHLHEDGIGEYEPTLILDINQSPADSLELVPGIGPVLAARIIEYRRQHGRFDSVDSLINVSGIGPVTLGKLRKYFKVDHR